MRLLALFLTCLTASAAQFTNLWPGAVVRPGDQFAVTFGAESGVAPSIVTHPVSTGCVTNGSADFTVTATGTAPLAYQWLSNGVDLVESSMWVGVSSNHIYFYPGTSTSANGSEVTCRVTNLYGIVVSDPASLTVTNAPGGGSEMNPTNGMGAIAALWWESSRSYVTNTYPIAANLGNVGAAWNGTNQTSAGNWPVRLASSANGKDTLLFNGGPWLENTAYLSGSPVEIFMFCRITNNGGASFFFDSDDSGNRNTFYDGGAGFVMNAGSGINATVQVFNKWTFFNIHFESANAFAMVNGVAADSTQDAGAGTAIGMVLGNHNGKANPSIIEVATFVAFTNSSFGAFNQPLTTVRSNALYYCTNRFGPYEP